MNKLAFSLRVGLIFAIGILASIYVVIARPGYLTNVEYLGALLFLEFLAAVIWNYRQRFFPFLLLIFLLAGTEVPLSGVWDIARWVVLAVGAVCGVVIYFKDLSHSFYAFHLAALFCVVAAGTSAVVCSYPKQALLKTLSLSLLFIYGSCGARLVLMRGEQKFLSGLLLGCELLIYFTGVQYFILRNQFFGNPNSLGMVMGVAGAPLMLWGVLVSESVQIQRRRTFALVLSLGLLLSSYARAGEIAAAVSCTLLCLALGRYRMLLKGIGITVLLAIAVTALVPLPNAPESSANLRSKFLFKGKEQGGMLGSRRSVWDLTISTIQQNPWFGSGFGTISTTYDSNQGRVGNFSSNSFTTREHGSSYLAIVEGVGLLGVVPFFCLLILVAANIGRALMRLWRTKDPTAPEVAIAFVLMAALVHALFEDWLFAVGNYVCIFFWTLAFVLPDVLRGKDTTVSQPGISEIHESWAESAVVPSSL